MEKKKGLFYLIASDFKKRAEYNNDKNPWLLLITFIFNQPLVGLTLFRISHFLQERRLGLFARLLSSINCYLCSMFIDPRAQIDEGFFLPHTFAVLIHGNAVIGKNVIVCQGVDIGIGPRKDFNLNDKVVIGDNSMIFSGAKVFGNISIGKNVQIGANSVVLDSIPDNAVAVGAPAKVVRIKTDAK